MVSLCNREEGHFTTFWQMLVLCANIYKLYDDFLFTVMLVLFVFTKYPLSARC